MNSPVREAVSQNLKVESQIDALANSETFAEELETAELRRISLDEYHRLIEMGFFEPEERLELIEGLLAPMSPIYPPHAFAVNRLSRKLTMELGEDYEVRAQQPVTIHELASELEPDVVVAAAQARGYSDRHPFANEILLIVEVSDSTLKRDRGKKRRTYASAGIQEYWIVNLVHRVLEVYRNPRGSGANAKYQNKQTFSPEANVTPLGFPGCIIELRVIFPPPVN